jgi:hypothetical protein
LLFSDDDGRALLLHVYFWLGCSLVLKENNCAFARNSWSAGRVWSGKWWGGTWRRDDSMVGPDHLVELAC